MRPDHFLFFFCALGIFNGILLAIYLLVIKADKQRRDYFLGGLVVMFLLRVGVSCGYYFEGRIPWSVVQLGMVANLMLGPFLLAYLCTALPVKTGVTKFVLQLLVLQLTGLVILGAFYPFADNVAVWDTKLRYLFHALLSIHLLAALFLTYKIVAPSRPGHRQARVVTMISLLICTGFAVSLFTDYSLGPLFASVFFYAGLFWWRWEESRVVSQPSASPTPLSESILRQLKEYLIENRRFAQPELKAKVVAKALGIPRAQLTQALNHQGQSFNQVLAALRVTEAKRLLQERPELTVEAVGYEAGFSSRSTFFAVFKNHCGVSPGAFQQSE